MKSGLEGRNNYLQRRRGGGYCRVSMKSGLEGRNNTLHKLRDREHSPLVSMKSGLEGRNNLTC